MRNSLFLTLGVCLFLMVSGCRQAASESPRVPADAPAGTTLHFICEVTDDGEPALTRYARTILTVK